MKNFDELNVLELDTIREIGSIGTGNAATALSSMLGCEVRIDVPEVRIMGYNEACLLYTSPSPRDRSVSRMPSSA